MASSIVTITASRLAAASKFTKTLAASIFKISDRKPPILTLNVVRRGQIDTLQEGNIIIGWAFERAGSRCVLEVRYDGEKIAEIIADLYRKDLEDAGIDDGRYGFSFPVPHGSEIFNPEKLQILFGNGEHLPMGRELTQMNSVDYLSSYHTSSINIELTSRCNLRCTYCAVSQPWYVGRDLKFSDINLFRDDLRRRGIKNVTINGHGETTIVDDWSEYVDVFAELGCELSIISNFAKKFEKRDIEAMARISCINVSVDTHHQKILQQIRRKVRLGTILENINAIRSFADEQGLKQPVFRISCVLSDKTASDIVDFVYFWTARNIKQFILCNLVEFEEIEGVEMPKHIVNLPRQNLEKFLNDLETIRLHLADVGGAIDIAGDLEEVLLDRLKVLN